MFDEYENVTEKEFHEFIENYPRKLTAHEVDFCSPPLVTYIDFGMGDALDGIVAKEYLGTSKKDDLWYMPESERYYILRNYEAVLQRRKQIKEKKQQIYANAVLKDGKLIFWKTGKLCLELYDFFDDFWNIGLNFAMEEETGRYELVTKWIKETNSDKEFYRQYVLHEDFKGIKPY